MSDTTKQCPFCAEIIKAEAVVCRFCGKEPELTNQGFNNAPQKKKGSFGKTFLVLLLGGTLFACCGIFALGLIFSSVPSSDITTSSQAGSQPSGSARPTSTPRSDGSSLENPVPYGSKAVSRNFEISILEIERPADARIQGGNMFNSEAEPGNEFMMVQVEIMCMQASDRTCRVSPNLDFSVIGSVGVVREPELFISGVPNILSGTEFLGGRSISGWLAFEVGQEETDMILRYEPLFSLTGPVYLAISDSD